MQGDANSFTANTFRPERDSAKKQTKLICVVCIVTVNRAISIGKKLEGNYCNWTMRDSSKLFEVVYKNELKLLFFMLRVYQVYIQGRFAAGRFGGPPLRS